MAKLAQIEARKAQAMQDTAESVAALHRKLDLLMAKLGIVDPETEVQSEAEQPQAHAEVQPEDTPPVEPEPAKGKKK